jgi:hypothetical protein
MWLAFSASCYAGQPPVMRVSSDAVKQHGGLEIDHTFFELSAGRCNPRMLASLFSDGWWETLENRKSLLQPRVVQP